MRVFLRNKQTRVYYAGPSEWAATAELAHQFISVSHAARFGLDHSLPDIELILTCYTLPDEIAMPLLPEWCNFDPPGHTLPPEAGNCASEARSCL
jgi:hypothetical protein